MTKIERLEPRVLLSAAVTSAHPANITSTSSGTINLGGASYSLVPGVSSTSIQYGQPITLGAQYNEVISGSTFPMANQYVEFYQGIYLIGHATTDAAGLASLTTTALFIGTQQITVKYYSLASDSELQTSPITVNVAAPAVVSNNQFAASADHVYVNQPFSLTATISPSIATAPSPTGTVSFYEVFPQSDLNPILIDTVPVQSDGTATIVVPGFGVEQQLQYTAIYSGDSALPNSLSSQITETILSLPTQTSIVQVSPSTAIVDQPITFTAQVAPVHTLGDAFNTDQPIIGRVVFSSNDTFLGVANVTDGVATLTTSTIPAGDYLVSARFDGSGLMGDSTSISPVELHVQTRNLTATVQRLKLPRANSIRPTVNGFADIIITNKFPAANPTYVDFLSIHLTLQIGQNAPVPFNLKRKFRVSPGHVIRVRVPLPAAPLVQTDQHTMVTVTVTSPGGTAQTTNTYFDPWAIS